MASKNISRADLARAMGISYVAVKKVLDGQTRAFTAENNSKVAALLGVSADWLATGDGGMRKDGAEPPPAPTAEPTPQTMDQMLETITRMAKQIKELQRSTAQPGNVVQIEHAWPFKRLTREQWTNLTELQREHFEAGILMLLGTPAAAGGGSGAEKRHAA